MPNIETNLSLRQLQRAIKKIERYKKQLNNKFILFLKALADVGIETGQSNMGHYDGYVVFSKRMENKSNSTIYVKAKVSEMVEREWVTKNGIQKVKVNPLLMAEFGSGWLAIKGMNENEPSNVGQGTFPKQKHAFNPYGWTWKDTGGISHWSEGELPTQPMYKMAVEMMAQVNEIAKEIFEND